MLSFVGKSFDAPDEVRSPDKTTVAVVDLDGAKAARLTLEPGWSWSTCVKPVVGTESCQALHLGVLVSGRMHVVHNDGTEADVSPGEAYRIAPGHDAWVVGDEAVVGFEFETATAATYAKA